jgi:hypothetical protein
LSLRDVNDALQLKTQNLKLETAMNKDNILYGVIGLLIGLIIGYLATNSINRRALLTAQTSAPSGAAAGGAGNLPADHPPLGGGSGQQGGDVMAVIEKARKEPSNFDAQMPY